jgi:hypothetical protein
MGRPDLAVPLEVGPDGVGTYLIADVPNTVAAIVLYDGAPRPDGSLATPDGRAELVPLHVNGGETNVIPDRYGAAALLSPTEEGLRMPLAGTVLAAAVPDGGATPWKPTFNLPETLHHDLVPVAGGVYTVWPLPGGRFDVGAALTGFVAGETIVNVVAGATTAAPVHLPVDGSATTPGCAAVSGSAPSPCENGLVCEPADGRCYECTASDASLCSGNACNQETHLCEAPAPSAATYCSACAASANCPSGFFCRIPSGATTGYCTTSGCGSDADCPAGFDCEDDVIPHFCKAPKGCDSWVQTMVTSCYSNSRCDSEYYGGLEHGWCAGDTEETPGHCTASCAVDEDCAVGSVNTLVCALGPNRDGTGTSLQCMLP